MNAAPRTPNPWPTGPVDPHEAIRRRAEEIYIRNGRIPGRDLQNWAQAEQEILQELAEHGPRRTAIVVRVNGVEYVGQYNPESCDGYTPGELGTGAPIPVRFHGDKMFVKRPNGKELETTIVKKTG
jgi:hypothetical protein